MWITLFVVHTSGARSLLEVALGVEPSVADRRPRLQIADLEYESVDPVLRCGGVPVVGLPAIHRLVTGTGPSNRKVTPSG